MVPHEAQRALSQAPKYLQQPFGIGVDEGAQLRIDQLDADRTLRRGVRQCLHRFAQDRHRIDALFVKRKPAALEPGEVERVGENGADPFGGPKEQCSPPLRFCGSFAARERRSRQHHRAERAPNFKSQGRNELVFSPWRSARFHSASNPSGLEKAGRLPTTCPDAGRARPRRVRPSATNCSNDFDLRAVALRIAVQTRAHDRHVIELCGVGDVALHVFHDALEERRRARRSFGCAALQTIHPVHLS